MDEATMTSPIATETAIYSVPYYQSFRSKEVWLHAFAVILQHAPVFTLSDVEANVISAEVFLAGDAGPGPRRLARFVAKFPSSKDP